MARSDINTITQDLQSDDGSVLWSLVLGEQIEYPITLNFLSNAYGYTYEAVVVEGDNVIDLELGEQIPENVKPNGVKTALSVRVPEERGAWNPATAYSREDVIVFNAAYYKLRMGTGRVSSTPPDQDQLWEAYTPNKVYVQFPKELGVNWSTSPTASIPVYGFFELRVTEPAGGIYQRTWKPVRGVVEFCFSPTEML